jgi:hypothetical protein
MGSAEMLEELVMKIVFVFTMMLAMITGYAAFGRDAQGNTKDAVAMAATSVTSVTSVTPIEEGTAVETQQIGVNGVCEALYAECTPYCLTLVGSARGACLRECRRDYEECLGQ